MFTENFPSFFRLWNPESGKNLNVESGILGWESGIPLKESGIARTIKIQNPSFTDKYTGIQYQESGIHGVESRIQDCPGFPYMGRHTAKVRFRWKIF